MKTAIQEFKYQLEQFVTMDISNEASALAKTIIADLDRFIADEKEQIYKAFVAGSERGTGEIPFNAEQYYSQTYSS